MNVSEGDEKRPKPRPRSLAVVGVSVLVVAGVVVAYDLQTRARASDRLVQVAAEQAVPTVAVVQPSRDSQDQEVVLPGTIQAYYNAPIYARVPGYLKVWNDDIGAKVKKGQVLATIDTPDLDRELDQAKADLGSAAAEERLAQLTAKRWKSLLGSQSVSQQTVDEKLGDAEAKQANVQAAQAKVDQLEAMEAFKQIVAPFDGVVTARQTDVGDLIVAGGAQGKELFQVSDIEKMRIYVQVPQAYSGMLTPGLTATMALPQYPGRSFKARLVTTSGSVAEASLTVLAELQTDNPGDLLTPGNFTEVHFKLPERQDVLRLPATALIFGMHGTEVATLAGKDQVTFKPVEIGSDLGTEVEVVGGLSPSDRVIDSPPETLVSGETVRLASDGAGTNPNPNPTVAENSKQTSLN
jgi:RND family efflux transporter MFP subunit